MQGSRQSKYNISIVFLFITSCCIIPRTGNLNQQIGDIAVINDSTAAIIKNRTIEIVNYNSNSYNILKTAVFDDRLRRIVYIPDNVLLVQSSGWTHKDSIDEIMTSNYYDYVEHFNLIYRSLDMGETWDLVSVLPTYPSKIILTDNGYIFSSNSVDSLNGYGIYRSIDKGDSWELCNTGLPKFPRIFALYSDTDDNLYAIFKDKVYKSNNYGKKWFQWSDNRNNITSVFFNDMIDDLVGATYKKEIFISENHGMNWRQIADFRDQSINKSYIGKNIIISDDARIIIEVNPYGIICSKDDYSSFYPLNVNATNYAVSCMALNSSNILLVGTFLEGLLIYDINKK